MKQIIKTLFLVMIVQSNGFSQHPGWEIISLNSSAEFKSIHFLDPFDLHICGDVLLNAVSADSGSTWTVNSFQPPVTLNDIVVINEDTIVAAGNGGTIMRTTDGGISWSNISSGVSDDLLSLSFVDGFGICGGISQTILYTSDSGESWNTSQTGFFGGGFWGATMLSPQIGFVAGENSISQPLLGQTVNSGQNWTFTPFYLNNNEGRGTGIDFTDIFTGYVSALVWDGRGAIARTTEGGSNWVTTFFANPLRSIDFPISNASQIGYAAGDWGVIVKTYDAGISWQPQESGTTLRLNKIYFGDLETGYAVGENGMLLRTTSGGEPVTKVTDNVMSLNEFALHQNYPNPFNPSTTIRYKIPLPGGDERGGIITLKVYDILGNEIATLVNEEEPAGEHQIEFEANELSSGVYFYRLTAGSFGQTRKMILVK